MILLASVPYLIIGLGLILGRLGLRPAMLVWAICMIGALSGLAIAIAFLLLVHSNAWILAVVSALPLIATVVMTIKDLSYPRINDVATDLINPPEFIAAQRSPANVGRDLTYPERFKVQVQRAYPDVQPLILDGDMDQVLEMIEDIARNQCGWKITSRNAEIRILEAEVMTSLLRFVDDVIIRVSDQEGKARVDMRSKSREGLVDAGKNAKRIRIFLEKVKQCGSTEG